MAAVHSLTGLSTFARSGPSVQQVDRLASNALRKKGIGKGYPPLRPPSLLMLRGSQRGEDLRRHSRPFYCDGNLRHIVPRVGAALAHPRTLGGVDKTARKMGRRGHRTRQQRRRTRASYTNQWMKHAQSIQSLTTIASSTKQTSNPPTPCSERDLICFQM